jgi:RNA polymerase sigma factor (sigma-70 family)
MAAKSQASARRKNGPGRTGDRRARIALIGRPAGRFVPAGDERRVSTGFAMTSRDESKTSPTLLGRLAASPLDQAASNEFVDRYGPRLLQWSRAWGLQEADSLDVSQTVLTRLAQRLRRFEYDPARRFRGWLRSLVKSAALDAMAARRRAVGTDAEEVAEKLASAEAREDLVRRLEEEFDLELLEAATAAVRGRVAARSWEAYHLTAFEGRDASEAAAMLGMRVGAVYQAKSSILQMLQQEVRRLGGGPEVGEPSGE